MVLSGTFKIEEPNGCSRDVIPRTNGRRISGEFDHRCTASASARHHQRQPRRRRARPSARPCRVGERAGGGEDLSALTIARPAYVFGNGCGERVRSIRTAWELTWDCPEKRLRDGVRRRFPVAVHRRNECPDWDGWHGRTQEVPPKANLACLVSIRRPGSVI
jgi:hypothetical protein